MFNAEFGHHGRPNFKMFDVDPLFKSTLQSQVGTALPHAQQLNNNCASGKLATFVLDLSPFSCQLPA
jgi:hypothetical protein